MPFILEKKKARGTLGPFENLTYKPSDFTCSDRKVAAPARVFRLVLCVILRSVCCDGTVRNPDQSTDPNFGVRFTLLRQMGTVPTCEPRGVGAHRRAS